MAGRRRRYAVVPCPDPLYTGSKVKADGKRRTVPACVLTLVSADD